MKFRDPITKQFKEIYTKAADTLPVGTIVEYEGTETPAGWELVETLDTGIKRIKKKEHSIGILGKIVNSLTNSTQDTYSADYINNLVNYTQITDCNDTTLESGCYVATSVTTNVPYASIWLINVMKYGDNIVQVAYRYRDGQVYIREYNGVGDYSWKPWKNLVGENDIWYKDGDTYELNYATYFGGQISGGATQVLFTIPLPKRLNKIKGITVNSYDITVRGVTGGYPLNRVTEDLIFDINPRQDNLLSIIVTTPQAMGTTNNSPCGVTLYGLKLTFNE